MARRGLKGLPFCVKRPASALMRAAASLVSSPSMTTYPCCLKSSTCTIVMRFKGRGGWERRSNRRQHTCTAHVTDGHSHRAASAVMLCQERTHVVHLGVRAAEGFVRHCISLTQYCQTYTVLAVNLGIHITDWPQSQPGPSWMGAGAVPGEVGEEGLGAASAVSVARPDHLLLHAHLLQTLL